MKMNVNFVCLKEEDLFTSYVIGAPVGPRNVRTIIRGTRASFDASKSLQNMYIAINSR